MTDQTTSSGTSVQAYAAGAIRVVLGANLGDAIGGPDAVALGDLYQLRPDAPAKRLVLARSGSQDAGQRVAPGGEIGAPGDVIDPLALLTLLSSRGERLVIVTVWHGQSGRVWAVPLSPMNAGTDYALIETGTDFRDLRLSDVLCVAFATGTLISLPGGRPQGIETLRAGDMILTRDHGPQPVRWVGKATLRAAGAFAPVVISAGTLGNLGDLVVSPQYRVCLYQRGPHRLGGAPEVLVQAKHLVDGDRVWRREGGYVDYYSLVFDRHEIIFAEGIATESLLVNEQTVHRLPEDLSDDLRARFPGLSQSPHLGTEAPSGALDAAGRSRLFRAEGTRDA